MTKSHKPVLDTYNIFDLNDSLGVASDEETEAVYTDLERRHTWGDSAMVCITREDALKATDNAIEAVEKTQPASALRKIRAEVDELEPMIFVRIA